ncbi:5834f7c0-8a9b-486d-a0c8-bd864eff9080 [Sclerotinia trifoliorum]|uniref:endo-1,3(4)-beta-glucanase n=1 Tax=Sclerotinia trifoliorum TaxID=28548 RepID=A0A8H2ZTI1_9HELO|nr:5834f7c0-8a9b-486d-a0c8-bd864eff9080 [Sclerotinia trifoliorum]
MQNTDMPRGPPPEYELDDPSSLAPRWLDVRAWSKKRWVIVGVGLVVLIIIVVVIAVEVSKKNTYPNYSQLSYSLKDTYSGTDFFDNFDYFNTYDPSAGFVHYVDSEVAAQYNLTYASSSSAVIRVDTSVTADSIPNASTGRFSVRIESKTQYTNGLFIFDIVHTPVGCATWPALWLSDPNNWPTNGEIDIMEAVNVVSSTKNQMTLHTTSGCSMDVKRKETGKALQSSCLNSTNGNAGCGVHDSSGTFGADFNSNGGGIMAMELRTAGIRLWQFGRDAIPSDISTGTPDPSTWSEATADFPSTDCNIGNHFKNQSIIVNIDLCGSWAGTQSVYDIDCPGTCTDYVANNATAFKNTYWEFNNFTVYQAS